MLTYWLFKKEPKNISIEDIKNNERIAWTGVRNYQARNYLLSSMNIGDRVLVYHSNGDPSGIVGVAEICSEAYPDVTAQDPTTSHYDPKATAEQPIWTCRDVRFVEEFANIISLASLREYPSLADMLVLKRGMRLSIQPVHEKEYTEILKIAHKLNH